MCIAGVTFTCSMDIEDAAGLLVACEPALRKAMPKKFPVAWSPRKGNIEIKKLQSLWAGMGYVYQLDSQGISIIVKRIRLPENPTSAGDRRKKASYDVEACFYSRGHAMDIRNAGCRLPVPLLVKREDDGLSICMTKLEGKSGYGMGRQETEAALIWLAALHAATWGKRSDVLVSEGGLQPQGCYWYLDTRQEEFSRMPKVRA
jgi:hypothetical protein